MYTGGGCWPTMPMCGRKRKTVGICRDESQNFSKVRKTKADGGCVFDRCFKVGLKKLGGLCRKHAKRKSLEIRRIACDFDTACVRPLFQNSTRCYQHRRRESKLVKHTIATRKGYAEKKRQLGIVLKLEKGPCVDCSETDIRVLEFDHLHGKIDRVGRRPLDMMRREAKKCVMRCRRCHRIRSEVESRKKYRNFRYSSKTENKQAIRKRKKMLMIRSKLKIGKCQECGWFNKDFTCTLDFDHQDPSQKFVRVSRMVNHCYSDDNIKKEIAKCQLLCANCHHLKTIYERGVTLYDDYASLIKEKKKLSK